MARKFGVPELAPALQIAACYFRASREIKNADFDIDAANCDVLLFMPF